MSNTLKLHMPRGAPRGEMDGSRIRHLLSMTFGTRDASYVGPPEPKLLFTTCLYALQGAPTCIEPSRSYGVARNPA